MAHVFLSYVRENTEQVMRLRDDLVAAGVEVWIDRDSIQPGVRWREAIGEAIQKGEFFIACFSEEYERREESFMNEELALAVEELKTHPATRAWFIPVILSDCSIPALAIGGGETFLDIQWVDLREDWDAGIKRIVSIIKPTPAAVRDLLISLRSSEEEIRARAASALQNAASPGVTEALQSALEDPNDEVRVSAARALLGRGDPGVVALSSGLVELAGRMAYSVVNELLRMVARDEPLVAEAAEALTECYRRSGRELKLLIVKNLADRAWSARDAYETKQGELVYFEGMLVSYPAQEETALTSFDRHLVPLLRDALRDSEKEITARARTGLEAIGAHPPGSWMPSAMGKSARAALDSVKPPVG